ncbi:MAG: PAS-domain containing protein [Rhizobiaceae bacterium]
MSLLSSFTQNGRVRMMVMVLSLMSIGVALYSLEYLTDRLLERDAYSVGMRWAEDIEVSLDDLDGIFAGNAEQSNAFQVLHQLSFVGRIYRYKFSNPQGKTVFDTKFHESFDPKKSDLHNTNERAHSARGHQDVDGHSHREKAVSLVEPSSHMKGGQHKIFLKTGDGITQPKYYSYVEHPVSKQGKQIGTLKLYINQTETQSLLRNSMLVVFIVLSCMSVLIFALPAFFYLQSKKKEGDVQQVLNAQQERFESALSNMHQGFCMFDENNNVMISNDRYATIYSLSPEHTKPGKNLRDIVQSRIENGCYIGSCPEEYLAAVDKLNSNRNGLPRVYQLNDGRYVEISDQTAVDGAWFTTHEDITVRVRAELKVQFQNDQFDTALSNISQGLCMFDGDKNLIVSNDRYATLFGLSPDMIRPGMNLSEIIQLRFKYGCFVGEKPDDYRSRADEWIDSLLDGKEIHKLNTGGYMEILIHPMDGGGWLATQTDVTERTEAKLALALQNHQFDMAISNISQGLCLFDSDKKLIVSNDLYARLFNLSPDMLKPGMHIRDILKLRVEKGSFVDDGIESLDARIEKWSDGISETLQVFQLSDGRYIEILSRSMNDGGWLSTQEDVTDRITAEKELTYRNDRLDAALKAMTQGLCMFDTNEKIVVSNDKYAEIYGISPAQIKSGTSLQEILELRIQKGNYAGSDPKAYQRERFEWLKSGSNEVIVHQLRDGRHIEIRNHPMGDDGWLLTHDDVTERMRSEAALSEQNERFDAAISTMSHGLAMFDKDENIIISNDRYATIYGLKENQLTPGMNVTEIVQTRVEHGCFIGDVSERYLQRMKTLKNNRDSKPKTYVLNDGRYVEIRDHAMASGGWLSVHEDVTDRYASEKKIKYLADYDSLTGLPNRSQIHEILETAIQKAVENDDKMALLYIDLDGFKEVNDTLGHPVGDIVLQEVGSRFSEFLNDNTIAGRLSGDEFVVIVKEFEELAYLERLGDRICEALATPIHAEQDVINISASIGMSVGPPSDGEADTLVQFSDLALYQAKADGGNCHRFFEEKMYDEAKERQRLALDLRSAIRNDELLVYYQPQIDLKSGDINGYEALCRWNHPELGIISPLKFIGLAEETGQINEIGEWVLRTACEYAVGWPNEEKVSVNLSSTQFKRQDVVALVKKVLWETGLEPGRLELEITESVLIQSADSVAITLRILADMGVSIALDDFGTGFSSLSYLTTFPFSKIKIDKTFIDDLCTDSEVTAIVSMIIGLGRSLDTIITAEGIEKPNQHVLLRAAGCDQGQGFLYGKPLPRILEASEATLIKQA